MSKRAQFLLWTLAVVAVVSVFLWILDAPVEHLMYASGLSQGVLAFIAAIWSMMPTEFTTRHRVTVIFTFGALGAIGVAAAISQGSKAAADSATATATIERMLSNLSTSTEQNTQQQAAISRQQAAITELAGQLLKASEVNNALANQAVSNATGGDSFGYILLKITGDSAEPFVMVKGRYPVYQAVIHIVDLNGFRRDGVSDIGVNDRFVPALDLHPEGVGRPLGIQLKLGQYGDEQRYNVFFAARNGRWIEEIVLRRIGGQWLQAYRVVSESGKILMQGKIPERFGSIEWGN